MKIIHTVLGGNPISIQCWTISEAAKEWKSSYTYVYRLVGSGRVQYIEENGHYYIPVGSTDPIRAWDHIDGETCGLSLRVSRPQYMEIMKQVDNLGYKSIASFVREAIAEKLSQNSQRLI